MTGGSWAALRQAVFAAPHLDRAVEQLRTTLRLPAGFADPELAAFGMGDRTLPVGSQFLEVVSPLQDQGPLSTFLQRHPGGGGYCLSVQVPDVTPIRQSALDEGIRIVADTTALGRRVLQLHPKDVGVLLEFDEIPERDTWFWDDVSTGPDHQALVDRLVGVQVRHHDPCAAAALWARLSGAQQLSDTCVDFGTHVSFLPGERAGWQGLLLGVRDGVPAPPECTLLGVQVGFLSAAVGPPAPPAAPL